MIRLRLLFAGAIFLGAFLLFVAEPMAAKQLLPVFGGSAAVWITCLVFFQTALLLGYLWAHWLARSAALRPNRVGAHLGLIAIAVLVSIAFAANRFPPGSGSMGPVLSIFAALSLSIGLPFLVLSSASPLLQVWWTRVEAGPYPYRLFALSNFASLLALGLYPSLIEPYFTLQTQRRAWTGGFVVFASLFAYLIWVARAVARGDAERGASSEPPSPATPLRSKLLWLLLPMGAAMQLSAVTSHLTENIAPIPLLWILPLAVYLITLILAFQFPGLIPRWILTRVLVLMLAGLGYMLTQPEGAMPFRTSLLFYLAELFAACLFCHAEACALRPQRASETTGFYLAFAAGGALGSFLIGIAAPMLFRFNHDLAISFSVTALLAAAVVWNSGWGPRLLWASASALMLALVFLLRVASQRETPVAVRNFYGCLRVKQTVGYPAAVIRTLSNGTIQHGTQIFSDALRRTPTTYYAEDSGVGLALRWCCGARARRIGVVGLGAGTLAAYAQPGDRFAFYEINPAVAPIAENLFTYIRDAAQSGAEIRVVEGDARTSLASELADGHAERFDVLVIDAFSGDAIPIHLLTTQAVELYKRHLAPGGILAFHISNQHVDLEPEVAQLARAAGMKAMRVSSPANDDRGEFSATWMLASASPAFFTTPEVFNRASEPLEDPKVRVWTDDYSSLLPLLRW